MREWILVELKNQQGNVGSACLGFPAGELQRQEVSGGQQGKDALLPGVGQDRLENTVEK